MSKERTYSCRSVGIESDTGSKESGHRGTANIVRNNIHIDFGRVVGLDSEVYTEREKEGVTQRGDDCYVDEGPQGCGPVASTLRVLLV
jgi:hypothetical protein